MISSGDAISRTPPRARCDSSSIFKKDLCLPTAFGCHWMERRLRCVAVLRSSQTSNPLDRQKERYVGSGELSTVRTYGQRIVRAGEPANSLFLLQSGMVSVKLPCGVRLASLGLPTTSARGRYCCKSLFGVANENS